MTGRSIDEWIGATPDTPIPRRVKIRVFLREEGRCHITGRKIRPGDARHFDHVIPLKDGGENRESNIKPALADAHRVKTAEEATARAKVDRIRAKHYGIKPRTSRPLFGTEASGWRKPFNAPPERRS